MRATEADSTYHEAWNLVGYSLRTLGRVDDPIEAYARCLRLKPDYAAAREYLGEAHLELGNLDMAKKQLALLERMNAEEPMATLKAAIDAYEKAHPAAPAGAGASGSN
jgi:tetratricopeptide (TPR) repeat protein